MLVLFISVMNTFFELIIVYYLSYNLIEKKPIISIKNVCLGILCSIVLGIVAVQFSSYFFKFISILLVMIILKKIVKDKIYNLLIMYVIIFLLTSAIQIIISLIAVNFPLKAEYIQLIVQTFTLIIIMFIHKEVSLYKLFLVIEKELLLKLFMFIMIGIFLILSSFLNFDFTDLIEYTLYFFFLILITFIGLFRTLQRVFFYTNKVPAQLHDVKNLFMGARITAYSTSDISLIRESLDQCLSILSIETSIEEVNQDEYENNIESFINQKKRSTTKEVCILTDIKYYENNAKITLPAILYILGVLIDNAIESGTKKVIFVKIRVAEERLEISVSNEYERQSNDDFEKMFKPKYSTKASTQSRGYGLSNLSKFVNSYDGQILLNYEYNEEHKVNYLTVTIIF